MMDDVKINWGINKSNFREDESAAILGKSFEIWAFFRAHAIGKKIPT